MDGYHFLNVFANACWAAVNFTGFAACCACSAAIFFCICVCVGVVATGAFVKVGVTTGAFVMVWAAAAAGGVSVKVWAAAGAFVMVWAAAGVSDNPVIPEFRVVKVGVTTGGVVTTGAFVP